MVEYVAFVFLQPLNTQGYNLKGFPHSDASNLFDLSTLRPRGMVHNVYVDKISEELLLYPERVSFAVISQLKLDRENGGYDGLLKIGTYTQEERRNESNGGNTA